jgi:hypothetical protein
MLVAQVWVLCSYKVNTQLLITARPSAQPIKSYLSMSKSFWQSLWQLTSGEVTYLEAHLLAKLGKETNVLSALYLVVLPRIRFSIKACAISMISPSHLNFKRRQ